MPSMPVAFWNDPEGRRYRESYFEVFPACGARVTGSARTKASARHVPDAVVQVSEIPRTLSGKKMEVPVRKLLLGAELGQVASPDAMENPSSLDFFAGYAKAIPGR